MRSIIGLTAALFLLAAATARAQDVEEGQGRIEGIVVSADGAPIDRVQVSIVDSRLAVLTDSAGRFEFGPVAVGGYVVEAHRIGFRLLRVNVSVVADQVAQPRLVLRQAPVTVDAVVVEALGAGDARTNELAEHYRVPPVGVANVTTVTSEEIRAVQASNPWDLVRETTGLEIHEQGQGPGFASNAVIRGFTSDHSADVALAIDGVPINEPINGHGEGYADWNLVFPRTIADLQVVKGPISPLFGNFANGGAVNVTTPAAGRGTEVWVEGGTYASGTVAATSGFQEGAWGGFGAGQLARTSGWRDNSSYMLGQLFGRLNRRIGRVLIDAGGQYYGTDWNSPGYITVDEYNAGNLTQAADSTDGGDKDRFAARLSGLVDLGSVSWQTTGWWYHSRWHLFLNIPGLGGINEGLESQSEELDTRTAFGLRSTALVDLWTWDLQLGVEAQRHDVSYEAYATTERVRDSTVALNDADFVNLGVFAGAVKTVARKLRVEGGLRLDVVRARSNDLVTGRPLPHDTKTVLNPKLGLVYYATEYLHFYGSGATGYRTPPALIFDPIIPLMRVRDLELGTRFLNRSLDVAFGVFRLDTDNERLFNPVTLQVESDGRSIREGFEFEVEFSPSRFWRVQTSWTVNTRGEFIRAAADSSTAAASAALLGPGTNHLVRHTAARHPEDLQGGRIPGVADFVGRAGLLITPTERLFFNTWATFMGPYVPLGEPDALTQTYTLFNLRATWLVTPSVEISGGVANIFDTKAVEIRASGFINPAAPRIVSIGVTTHFGGPR